MRNKLLLTLALGVIGTAVVPVSQASPLDYHILMYSNKDQPQDYYLDTRASTDRVAHFQDKPTASELSADARSHPIRADYPYYNDYYNTLYSSQKDTAALLLKQQEYANSQNPRYENTTGQTERYIVRETENGSVFNYAEGQDPRKYTYDWTTDNINSNSIASSLSLAGFQNVSALNSNYASYQGGYRVQDGSTNFRVLSYGAGDCTDQNFDRCIRGVSSDFKTNQKLSNYKQERRSTQWFRASNGKMVPTYKEQISQGGNTYFIYAFYNEETNKMMVLEGASYSHDSVSAQQTLDQAFDQTLSELLGRA